VNIQFALFQVAMMVLPVLVGGVMVLRGRGAHDRRWSVERFLLAFLVIGVGVQGAWIGLQQMLTAEQVAEYVGWPYSPFINELGYMNFMFGLLGILCIWVRGTWWNAAGIGYAGFLLLAAANHIYDAVAHDNLSIGNVGPTLWSDIVIGGALLLLLYLRHRLDRQEAGSMVLAQPRTA